MNGKRRRIDNAEKEIILMDLVNENRSSSGLQIANRLVNEFNINISERTVQRTLKRMHYKKLVPKRVPNLNDRQKLLRV